MIDILIPSYSRPHRLKQTIASIQATSETFVNILVYVDMDDKKTTDAIEAKYFDGEITFILGQKMLLSDYYNHLLEEGTGRIVFLGADDIIFETHGWDLKVIRYFKSLPDMIGMFYGLDGHNTKNATHPFVSRRACQEVGYFTPPYFEADFNDLWLHEVYSKLNRIHFDPSIMIRHNHRNANEIFDDETYRIAEPRRERAAKVWEEKKGLIDEDVKKLKQIIVE